MSRVRHLLRQADPLTDEGDWGSDTRARVRQTIVQPPAESELPPRRSVVKVLAAGLVLTAALGVAASFFSPSGEAIAAVRFEVRLAEEAPGDGLRAATASDSKRTIYLHQDVVVTNGDIARASAQRDPSGDFYSVAVTFTAEGARKMEAATRTHNGKPMAVLIDGEVVSCPTVRGVISGSAIVDARYTKAQADRIVAGILGK